MIRVSDIQEALKQQAASDMNRLDAIDAEQRELREQYLRFRDLDDEKKLKNSRLQRTASVLGDIYEDMVTKDKKFRPYAIAVSEVALWEAMLAILEHVPEMQLHELQHTLAELGKKVSRQAIESAVTTHRDKFESKPRGRDKFVSLKR